MPQIELERIANEITNQILEEYLLADLKPALIPTKTKVNDKHNVSISINIPNEVQNSACTIVNLT
jgi:hypothetical protein